MQSLNLPKIPTYQAPARLWKRLAAFLVDVLILDMVVFLPFRSILSSLIPTSSFSQTLTYLNTHPQSLLVISLIFLIMGSLSILYFSIMEYLFKQTIGKMLLGIEVSSKHKELFFHQSLLRSLYLLLIFPFSLLIILDPLFLLFTKDHRRFSEMLSNTKTVERMIL